MSEKDESKNSPEDNESSKRDSFFVMDALKDICINNIEFFKNDESTYGLRWAIFCNVKIYWGMFDVMEIDFLLEDL